MEVLSALGYTKVREVVEDKFARAREVFEKIKSEAPEPKSLSLKHGVLLYGTMAFVGAAISSAVGVYIFFGSATLLGFVALTESNKYMKYAVSKSNKLIDFTLFGLTLYATASLGVTISAALTVAGLGYSLIYAPYLRSRYNN